MYVWRIIDSTYDVETNSYLCYLFYCVGVLEGHISTPYLMLMLTYFVTLETPVVNVLLNQDPRNAKLATHQELK